ncbi:ASPIC and UnbV [Stieleria neptunia]|uniref:ASPIC and UnbV n=1 Tax=Stieleria neptunia TaxID=2527979 RepID=A0A518I1T4_9BACT|nr:ASPIC/UnbV domain-containing protein [Stieleria neptunia]QDV47038.1 ASPIC and UnbV [Stieleria neptunia]
MSKFVSTDFRLVVAVLLSVAVGCGDRGSSTSTREAERENAAEIDPASPARAAESRLANLSKIRRLIAVGDEAGAMQAVQSHLLRYPDDSNAMVLASGLFNRLGQVDDAVAMLDSAAELSADDGWKWRQRAATMLSQAGRWGEAIARLEGLLQEQPELDDVRHALVAVLNQRGFRFDANEHVRRLSRTGNATLDELRGLIFPARSFTGMAEKPKVEDVEQHRVDGEMNVARAMYGEGDVRDASQVLRISRLLAQHHPAAMAFYGQLLIESQQFDAFQQWLGDVDQASHRYPAYWLALGGWAMRQRQFDLAAGQFGQAILREPGDLAATDRMAQALSAGGHLDDYERFRQRGVLIDRLMRVTRKLLTGKIDPAAIDQISKLLNESGRPIEALGWYRIALQNMGSPANGLRQLNQALAMADDETFQRNNRALVLCGVDLDRFPSDVEGVALKTVMPNATPSPAEPSTVQSHDPVFANVASQVGLEFTYYNAPQQRPRELRLFEQFGAGVACIDYDLDGNVDFYLGQASSDPPHGRGTRPNMLSRSLGDRFVDVTASAQCDDRGYTCGITAGDWNQDGFPDLVIANLMGNTLLINRGDGTFVPHAGDSVWDEPLYTTSLAIGDVSGDHLPDLVEVNYVDDASVFDPIKYKADGTPVRLPAPLDFRPSRDRLFLSAGDGTMAGQWIDESGQVEPGTGLGVILTDLDGAPGNEILIVNDHLANHLWQRGVADVGRSNVWHDTAAAKGLAFGARGTPLGCMGVAVGDFDQNGRPDLHVTNFEREWNNQFMQDQSGFFDDLVVAFGLDQPTFKMLGFGVQAFDYDNNTKDDLVIGNGHIDDYSAEGRAFEMPTLVFALDQSRFVFKDVGGDPAYWNAGHLSRALASCDWNNDGRIDFVVTDLIEPLALLENRTQAPHHWVQLQLVGTTAERDAIGATVTVSIGDQTLTRVVQSGDGYMCRNQAIVSFGLGEHEAVKRLEIRWPDGEVQRFANLAADRRLIIVQSQDDAFELD